MGCIMITLFSIFLLLPLPMLLNRWRGTGTIFNIFGFRLIGNIIYAIYIALLIGFASALNHSLLPFTTIVINGTDTVYILENTQGFSSFIFAFLGAGLYIFGESFAWGKWVGFLTKDNQPKDYDNDDGRSFPYIHYMANFFIKEKEDYLNYCRLALSIRGFIWWTPILILLGFIDLLSWYQVAINSIILAVGFPIGCELSKFWNFEYKSKFLSISGNWEKQEVIYGFIQFVCITFSIFLFTIIK